jgi:uncharacterized membrane protein YjjP (DUF1212 family)
MATKEMRALLLTAGTAFLSGGVMLIGLGKYIEAVILAIIGIAAFYTREVTKEEDAILNKEIAITRGDIRILKHEIDKLKSIDKPTIIRE